MNLPVFLLAAATFGSTGAAGPVIHADPPQLATRTDAEEYFGPVTLHHWTGAAAVNGRGIQVSLSCMEAEYSAYDLLQTRDRLHGKAEVSGVFCVDGKAIMLLGGRVGKLVSLVDADMLFDPAARSGEWQKLVDRTKEMNAKGIPVDSVRPILLTGDDGVEFSILAAQDNVAMPNDVGVHLQRVAMNGVERCSWVAASEADAADLRFEVATWSLSGSNDDKQPISLAVATARNRDRRVAGPVPAGSNWPSRAALVQAIQDIENANIDWYLGGYNDAAADIVHRYTGVRQSKAQFEADLLAVFGSRDAALLAACPLQEVRHTPVLIVQVGDQDRAFGSLRHPFDDGSRTRHVHRYLLGGHD